MTAGVCAACKVSGVGPSHFHTQGHLHKQAVVERSDDKSERFHLVPDSPESHAPGHGETPGVRVPKKTSTRWLSSDWMTVTVVIDSRTGRIIETPPIVAKFRGQHIDNLLGWMATQPGFETDHRGL